MQHDASDPLFTALAEYLKHPLLRIARLSETGNQTALSEINVLSEQALRLVDAYAQYQVQSQMKLALEPVNSGAVLYDVLQTLRPLAQQAEVNLIVDQKGKAVPIMAHRDSLRAMLTLVGASLIEAAATNDSGTREVVLGAHRATSGTVIGAFSAYVPVSQHALQLVRQLHGKAIQAAPILGSAGGAGLAIADLLGEQMEAPLKAYRHRSLQGIGSLWLPSHQLQLL